MVTDLKKTANGFLGGPLACAYQYDQLNRIQQMRSYHRGGNAWVRLANDRGLWDTEYDFDKNGNIERLHRRKPDLSAGLASVGMDRLTYHYNLVGGKKVDNKLGYVSDGATLKMYSLAEKPLICLNVSFRHFVKMVMKKN